MEKNRRLFTVVSADPDAARPRPQPRRVGKELSRLRQQVAGMLDREAIRQLPIAHAHFVRARDVEGMVSLYAKDAVLEVPGMEPWPLIHGHYFEMRGSDRAEGFVYIEFRMAGGGLQASHVGCYRDDYVKEDGVWKFRSRRLCAMPITTPGTSLD